MNANENKFKSAALAKDSLVEGSLFNTRVAIKIKH